MKKRTQIAELRFESSVKPGLRFEIMKYSTLMTRVTPEPTVSPTRFTFHLVYFVVSGRTQHAIDFVECPLGPGDLAFLSSGRVQSFERAPGLEMWMLLFTPDFLSLSFDSRAEDPLRTARVLSPFLSPPVVTVSSPADRAELTTLIELLDREYHRPTDGVQAAVLSSLLRTFLLRAERLLTPRNVLEGPRVDPQAEAFRDAVERSFLQHRSIKVFARQLGVSPRALNALTQRSFGRTAKAYVDERTILELKRLLAHTDISVKALSSQFHFGEPTNLVKYFRRHTGLPPLSFRSSVTAAHPPASAPRPERRRSNPG